MATKRADIVAALASELGSPGVIAAIDKVIVDLQDLRKIAVNIHGEPTQASAGNTAEQAEAQPHSKRQNDHARVAKGTLAALVQEYLSNKNSSYEKVGFRTKEHYRSCLKRIIEDHGETKLVDLKKPEIEQLYQEWTKRGEAMAHSLVAMLRILVNYGAVTLEDSECVRLSVILRSMRFKMVKRRSASPLSSEHIRAIIDAAHGKRLQSIALAQAFQSACKIGQKELIGEWLPISEPGTSDIVADGWKWLRGLRWTAIDNDLILRNGEKEFDLKKEPLILEEFNRIAWGSVVLNERGIAASFKRNVLPSAGPLIVYERTGLPYHSHQFRRMWRIVADAAGVPKDARNMDSGADEKAA